MTAEPTSMMTCWFAIMVGLWPLFGRRSRVFTGTSIGFEEHLDPENRVVGIKRGINLSLGGVHGRSQRKEEVYFTSLSSLGMNRCGVWQYSPFVGGEGVTMRSRLRRSEGADAHPNRPCCSRGSYHGRTHTLSFRSRCC